MKSFTMKEGMKILVKFYSDKPILCVAHYDKSIYDSHKRWFLLQNQYDGTVCENKLGFQFSWVLPDTESKKWVYDEKMLIELKEGYEIYEMIPVKTSNITINFNKK